MATADDVPWDVARDEVLRLLRRAVRQLLAEMDEHEALGPEDVYRSLSDLAVITDALIQARTRVLHGHELSREAEDAFATMVKTCKLYLRTSDIPDIADAWPILDANEYRRPLEPKTERPEAVRRLAEFVRATYTCFADQRAAWSDAELDRKATLDADRMFAAAHQLRFNGGAAAAEREAAQQALARELKHGPSTHDESPHGKLALDAHVAKLTVLAMRTCGMTGGDADDAKRALDFESSPTPRATSRRRKSSHPS